MTPATPFTPLRVLQVINVRWYNATAWYAVTQARLMAQAGHQVTLAALPGSPAAEAAREAGLPVVELDVNSFSGTLSGLPRILGLLAELKPHVVNCHRGEGYILFALARLLSRLPGAGRLIPPFALVRTRGDQRPPKANGINRLLHATLSDAVIATNTRTAAQLRDRLSVPPERLFTIFGGADPARFAHDADGRARVRAEFGYTEDERVLGLLGRLDEVKGQAETVKALAALHAKGLSETRLLLIGHDSAMTTTEILAVARALGMADFVRVTGKREDLAACLSALDVALCPSLYSEAIARAALECLLAGVPTIASDTGVFPDIFPREAVVAVGPEEDRAGFVTRLAERLERCLSDEPYRAKLQAEEKRAAASLTETTFLRQSLALLDSLRRQQA